MNGRGKSNQFSISLPDGWEDMSTYIFQGPEDNGVQHNLTLTIDRHVGNQSLVDFAQERLDLLLESLAGTELLKQEETTLADGSPAYEAVYKWIPSDDKNIFTRVVYIVKGGVGYTFSASFSKKTIQTIGEQVREMINSFQPLM